MHLRKDLQLFNSVLITFIKLPVTQLKQVPRTLLINRKTRFVVRAKEKIDGPFMTLIYACLPVFYFKSGFLGAENSTNVNYFILSLY